MAIARDTTARNIRPLEGSITRRYTAGAVIAAGEIVSVAADTFVDPANASNATLAKAKGIALQAASAAGEIIDVVVFGPVKCLTGATPGATVFAGDTAGEPVETAGTVISVVGTADTAEILFVNPHLQTAPAG